MATLREWIARFWGTLSPSRRDADLEQELRLHLDLAAEDERRRAHSSEGAGRAAVIRFGGTAQAMEALRDQRGLPWLETIARDLRFAVRTLRKSPGLATAVVMSLALGIGANTAIFSVLNAAMLRSLPVPHPDDLFIVSEQAPVPTPQRFSYPVFERLREGTPETTVLAGMSRIARMQGRFVDSSENERLNVQLVSGDYFSVFELRPSRGRVLAPDDNHVVGGHPVAVISDTLWRGRFGGASDIVGRELSLNGAHLTIVGVGPAGFSGVWLESPADVWIPLVMQRDVHYRQNFSADNADLTKPWVTQEGISWVQLIGRTSKKSQTAAALNVAFQQELARRAEGIRDPDRRGLLFERRLRLDAVDRGLSNVRPRLMAPLSVLMAMVALVLLIACANGANLLMARAAARQREIAIRLSIGASRGRLIQQLLTESSILVGAATLVGLFFARWGGDELARELVGAGGSGTSLAVSLDGRVLAFTLVVSTATGLLFGLAPALRTTEVDLSTMVRSERKTLGIGARLKGPKLLVALQVAFSLWLVVGAGLFVRSFRNLTEIALGFEPERVTSAWINRGIGRYPDSQLQALNQRLIASVEKLPGVRSASLATCGLATGCRSTSDVTIAGYQPRVGETVRLLENNVSPRYFSTVGMRLVTGRNFDEHDAEQTPRVAIVNQAMARRYFAGRDSLGQRFGYEKPDLEIVGIVEDARVLSVQEPPAPMAFYPLAQRGHVAFSLDVRAAGSPQDIVAGVRKAVAAAEPTLLVDRITTLSEQVGHNLDQERFIAGLTALFGALALGLACLGLFGVMSYTVSRRTPEFGVRMALGARPFTLLWTVFRESLTLIGVGLAVGIPTILFVSQFVTRVLFEIRGDDPVTLAAATLLLVGVAAVAGLVPAWRAAHVDPLVALRCD